MNESSSELRDELLKRIELSGTLDELLQDVCFAYGLGSIASYQLLPDGYDDVNAVVTTHQGQYVIKVFRKETAPIIVKDIVRVISELDLLGAPVPRLILSDFGYLYHKGRGRNETRACVMECFAGEDFEHVAPSLEELKGIAVFLSQLHSLPFRVTPHYDEWATANLASEFARKRHFLSPELLDIIEPIAREFEGLELEKLDRCDIHGDLHKRNVMRTITGRLCVVDFSCMDVGHAAVDLSIFLALCCFDPQHPEASRAVMDEVIKAYRSERELKPVELEYIPLLIRATFAMYALSAQYLITAAHDKKQKTRHWLEVGVTGLKRF